MTTLQQQAVDRARDELKDKPWFKGICTDSLPRSDVEILETGLDEVVDQLILDTMFWDSTEELCGNGQAEEKADS